MKKLKVPAHVVERAKAAAKPAPPPKPALARPVTAEKKAKLVAALKRLHPMD